MMCLDQPPDSNSRMLPSVIDGPSSLSVVRQQIAPLAASSIKAPPRPPTLPIDGADGTSYSVPMHQAGLTRLPATRLTMAMRHD